MTKTASLQIDLDAIRHNLNLVKQLAPRSKILAMVKANAYGHGLIPVAKTLSDADGLAVARLDEAITLRKNGIEKRIVLLGTLLSEQDIQDCAKYQLDVVIHDRQSAQTFAQAAIDHPLAAWLKVDTGMHRLGLIPEEYDEVYQLLNNARNTSEIINMTHFGCADELDDPFTQQQLDCFNQLTDKLTHPKSAANSAALIRYPHTQFDWVRPGIMLYGADPLAEGSCLPLRPAMSLTARVLAVRDLSEHEAVGYGRSWQADRPTQLATIGIGYGDGYPRHAPNGTPVLINQQLATLAGRVSMDLITVDITDCNSVSVGDEVVLWNDQLKATEIARQAETISYELFTSITDRVERKYC